MLRLAKPSRAARAGDTVQPFASIRWLAGPSSLAKRARPSLIGLIGLSFLFASPAIADHSLPIPSSVSSGGWGVGFYGLNAYNCMPNTPIPVGADRNFLPTARALDMLQALVGPIANLPPGNPVGFQQGYGDLGFLIPPPGIVPIFSYDCAPGGAHDADDCDSGSANDSFIKMPSTSYCAGIEENIRRVMGHEYFHLTQFQYFGFSNWLAWGRAMVEGSARMMEDQVFSDLDDPFNTASFINEANNYLQNPGEGFWWSSYRAALGWKYASEQFGTITTEPERGSDFVRQFWENSIGDALLDGVDAPGTFAETIAHFVPGKSLRSWFHDFTIANLARQYDLSLVPNASLYRYIDESDGTGSAFTNVVLDGLILVPGGQSSGSTQIGYWAAAYYLGIAADCNSGDLFGFRASDEGPVVAVADGGSPLRFALLELAQDGANGRIETLLRGAGAEFGAAFVLPDSADTQIAVVITTTDGARNVDYAFACGPGSMTILLPFANYKAYVGPPGPDRVPFKVAVRITGPSSISAPTVRGLQKEDFSVYVGANNVRVDMADVQGVAEVGETYFLTVYPPDKGDTGTYSLYVNLGSATANQALAVSYEEKMVDEMVVLDKSGSMLSQSSPEGGPKIVAAQSAASQMVDRANDNSKIGAVAFDGNASLLKELADATTTHKGLVTDEINDIVVNAFGLTSIGDGLSRALDEFNMNGGLGEDWIILLSDGVETAPLNWPVVQPLIVNSGIRVVTFALGEDADHELMSQIAKATNGFAWPLDAEPEPAPLAAGSLLVQSTHDPLPNQLADAFLIANEAAEGLERLWEIEGALNQSASDNHMIVVDEGGIVNANFSIHWNNAAELISVQITRPDLSVVTHAVAGAEIFTGGAHVVLHVGTLGPGTWQVQLTATTGDPEYLAVLAGKDLQAASVQLEFGQTHDDSAHAMAGIQYLWGLPQPIVAILGDKAGPISGVNVDALVQHPDGSYIPLPLLDDGMHGDGAANDGVYANVYTRTTSTNIYPNPGTAGSYRIVLVASGSNNLAQSFVRIRKRAFIVSELNDPPPDSDGDGMPDRYEALHHCLDAGFDDADDDPDLDLLSNLEEWQVGTAPCHPDTDHGGESDGSEVLRGANPFDPEDDALESPIDPEVIDWIAEHMPFPAGIALRSSTNLIRYSVNSTYTIVHLWRATSPSGPFSIIRSFSGVDMTGLYEDAGLSDGVTYWYRVQPEDLNGNLAAPSILFSGTPSANPVPPIGSIIVENNASQVDTTSVQLSLVASSDTVDVMISNEASFSGSSWQGFANLVPWVLGPDAQIGLATVYVRYRDVHGNESPSTYSDSTIVMAPNSLGRISGAVELEDGADPPGILIRLLGESGAAPAFADSNGEFVLPYLLPGTYDIVIERDGYQTLTVLQVVVLAGANTNIGGLTLLLITQVPMLPLAGTLLLILAMGWGAVRRGFSSRGSIDGVGA